MTGRRTHGHSSGDGPESQEKAYVVKPCWRDAGLSETGAALADEALSAMLAIVENVGSGVAREVLKEAVFRVELLPSRDPTFRRAYLKENE